MNDYDKFYKKAIGEISHTFKNKEQREKMEDYANLGASILAAETVPVLGQAQLASQFLDFIDPYGYNKALNRKQVNEMLSNQYEKIGSAQQNILKCYSEKDKESCKSAGISDEQLQTFLGYSEETQNKILKTRTSWLYPTNPVARYPQTFPCMVASDYDYIQTNCKDEDYKKIYSKFWNENAEKFKADAKQAEKEAAEKASKDFITVDDGTSENSGGIGGIGGITGNIDADTKVKMILTAMVGAILILILKLFF